MREGLQWRKNTKMQQQQIQRDDDDDVDVLDKRTRRRVATKGTGVRKKRKSDALAIIGWVSNGFGPTSLLFHKNRVLISCNDRISRSTTLRLMILWYKATVHRVKHLLWGWKPVHYRKGLGWWGNPGKVFYYFLIRTFQTIVCSLNLFIKRRVISRDMLKDHVVICVLIGQWFHK